MLPGNEQGYFVVKKTLKPNANLQIVQQNDKPNFFQDAYTEKKWLRSGRYGHSYIIPIVKALCG